MKILKKITDKKILYIFTFCILFILPIIKQLSFYLVKFDVIKNYDSINIAYILYFCIPFLIYIYIKNLIKSDRDLDIYDFIFFILVLSGLIVCIFSMDIKISFFGKDFRHEGFFSLLTYYLLFIDWKVEGKREDINKIINMIIIISLINSIYSIFQIYTDFSFILRFTSDKHMASGLCGNPNFLGSLIVTALSIVSTKFLIEKFKFKNLILIIIFFITLINCQSTGPFLAYVITLIFLLIYLFVKKKYIVKNIIYLILTLIVTYVSIYLLNNVELKFSKCEMCDFTKVIVGKISSEENTASLPSIGSGRWTIWDNSLKISKENLINGVGYDNLYLAYYKGINLDEVYFVTSENGYIAQRKYEKIVDNAHNIYLHMLVSSGLIGLIPYLLLCLLTFIKGLKTNNNLIIILLGGFVAYSIQAFANISVIHVAPIYFILIGLILIKE